MSAEFRGYLLLAFSTHCVRKHRNPSSPGQWLGRSYITFPVADNLLDSSEPSKQYPKNLSPSAQMPDAKIFFGGLGQVAGGLIFAPDFRRDSEPASLP